MLAQSTKSLHPSFGVPHVLRVCLTHFRRIRLRFVSLLLGFRSLPAGVSTVDLVRAAPVGSVLFHVTIFCTLYHYVPLREIRCLNYASAEFVNFKFKTLM